MQKYRKFLRPRKERSNRATRSVITAGKMYNHELSEVLERGFAEMDIPPTELIPSLAECQHKKIHSYWRLTDGLWHRFRHTDPELSAKKDEMLTRGLL